LSQVEIIMMNTGMPSLSQRGADQCPQILWFSGWWRRQASGRGGRGPPASTFPQLAIRGLVWALCRNLIIDYKVILK
jgi:hypothetical protein